MNKSILNRIVRLLIGVGCILLLMFVIAPLIQQNNWVNSIQESIREEDIDATALFYTENKESVQSEIYLSDAIKYSPADFLIEK